MCVCVIVPKTGEQICTKDDDCDDGDKCRDGKCGCQAGDSVLSEDKYVCHRKDQTLSMFSMYETHTVYAHIYKNT